MQQFLVDANNYVCALFERRCARQLVNRSLIDPVCVNAFLGKHLCQLQTSSTVPTYQIGNMFRVFLFFPSAGLSAFLHVGRKVDLSDLNSTWSLQLSSADSHDVIKIIDLNISHTDWSFVLLNWKIVQKVFLKIFLSFHWNYSLIS